MNIIVLPAFRMNHFLNSYHSSCLAVVASIARGGEACTRRSSMKLWSIRDDARVVL